MKFTDSHEWIKMEGDVGIVGITAHAQEELGEIVFVELPKIGDHLEGREEVCVLESTKAAADIYCPAGGKIVAVNESLKNDISALNKDPEGLGWLFEIEVSNPNQVEKLLTKEEYQKLLS
ncbi:MAG: glycine cleavage system protein GcvH [Simkaniaceae bacterium]|nr:glycine cleavage system protein GcvH [Simkaniaceae bacterium]